MTLEGARKVMRRASGDELARETELLERLQRIRSALVEVREELKAGNGEQVVDSVGAELREAEDIVAEVAQEEPVVDNLAASEATHKFEVDESQAEAQQFVEKEAETAADAENVVESDAEQPAKKRVRRRKKSDDDNKELFPFYEQSLF